MMDKNKRITFIVLCVLLGVIFISLSGRHYGDKKKTAIIADKPPFKKKETPAPALVPARPEDYGMVVFEGPLRLLSETEANDLIRRKMQEIKTQFPKEVLKQAREKIKEDPQKTKEKLAQIDKAILKYRRLLQDNPRDEEAQRRLENLLLLKSIAKELPKE